MPGHQRAVVIGPEIVQVFEQEKGCAGILDFRSRRQHPVRENVFLDPGVDTGIVCTATDRVQQQQALLVQAAPGHGKKIPVVFRAHMLEHADRGHAVEAL